MKTNMMKKLVALALVVMSLMSVVCLAGAAPTADEILPVDIKMADPGTVPTTPELNTDLNTPAMEIIEKTREIGEKIVEKGKELAQKTAEVVKQGAEKVVEYVETGVQVIVDTGKQVVNAVKTVWNWIFG